MSLNLAAAGSEWDAGERSWDPDDVQLYAVGVGAGAQDPTRELEFTTENSHGVAQRVLPTFATVISPLGSGPSLGDLEAGRVLHGEQSITLHRAIPPAGTVRIRGRVDGFYDKGADALIVLAFDAVDMRSDEPLFTSVMTLYARGEGGFGRTAVTPEPWTVPDGPADSVVQCATAPNQALLYRLCGDRNPLHSNPWLARRSGFDRPILHGLCTFGFTGRALLHHACQSHPTYFRGMRARFSAPVVPGDILEVHIWEQDSNTYLFRTQVGSRVVLDRGVLSVAVPDGC